MALKSWLKIFCLLMIAVRVQAITGSGLRPFGRRNGQVARYTVLTRAGVDKIKSSGLLFLNQQLVSSTRAIQWQYDTTPRGIQGFFQVAQIQPTGYMAPKTSFVSFVPPEIVTFTIEDAGIAITGRFFGNQAAPPFGELPAQITGQITGVSLALLTQFSFNSNGGLELSREKPAKCSALAKNAQFTLEPDGQYAWYVRTFEQEQVRYLVKSLEYANPLSELENERLVKPLNSYRLPSQFIVWNGVIVSKQTDLRL